MLIQATKYQLQSKGKTKTFATNAIKCQILQNLCGCKILWPQPKLNSVPRPLIPVEFDFPQKKL